MEPASFVIREAEVLERQATHLVGTLGHVSEGKSTLIRSLTGVKTQRHAKEQERNITIHLGYANCKVYRNSVTGETRAVQTKGSRPDGDDWSLVAHLSFVDCPGHEAYLATMLGGASVMDSACLIIAANQEVIPQPQTFEHLVAAELMGLDRMCIVQNKLDLIDEATAVATKDKIAAFTTDTVAALKPVFPVSAQHGWGTSRVLDHLLSLPPPARDLDAPARLTCVRSFDVNRPGPVTVDAPDLKGAVIGGTLEQGVLAVGDWLEIRPGVLRRGPSGEIVSHPLRTRVRGLRCEETDLPYAVPGSLIAIATDLDPGLSSANGMIGQRVGVPGTLPPICGEVTMRLYKIKREGFTFGKHRVGDRVRICSNVMTTEGRIVDIDDRKRVRIALDRPLCLDVGERVSVLRHHAAAGRELLEGAGEIKATVPWASIVEPADEAVGPNRRIVWTPIEKVVAATTIPSYSDMLSDVMRHKVAGPVSVSRIPEPVVERVNKENAWMNWSATIAALDAGSFGTIRYADHFLAHFLGDLHTTGSVNAAGQLYFAGRWRSEDVRTLLSRYCSTYKRCPVCRGFDTGLVKVGQTHKLRCSRCATDHIIDSV
jgi:translation initiation factor 2 subunit 3